MTQMVVKDCVGASGGLVVFWKKEFTVEVHPFMSKYHIDMDIVESDGFTWRFTGYMGSQSLMRRTKRGS